MNERERAVQVLNETIAKKFDPDKGEFRSSLVEAMLAFAAEVRAEERKKNEQPTHCLLRCNKCGSLQTVEFKYSAKAIEQEPK